MTQISSEILVENGDEPPRTTALNSRGLDALGIGCVKLGRNAGNDEGRWVSCGRQKQRRRAGESCSRDRGRQGSVGGRGRGPRYDDPNCVKRVKRVVVNFNNRKHLPIAILIPASQLDCFFSFPLAPHHPSAPMSLPRVFFDVATHADRDADRDGHDDADAQHHQQQLGR